MPFLAPTLDNPDPLFALGITPGFYLHHVERVHQDPASGSLSVTYLITQNISHFAILYIILIPTFGYFES